ncbi:MAG: HAMP domain-containing histidine kinase [Oscillospiraceae bacterium]|nr:HAMP domain-containing histidine kinase [Oscillospiraceae bacterium]
MNANLNMPCIVFDKDFNIISADKQLTSEYPFLCDSDYMRSIFDGVDVSDLSSLTLLNTVFQSDIRLAALSQDDTVKCYILNSDTSYVAARQNIVSYQMREPISSIFALLPIVTDSINNNDSDKAIKYLDNIYSKSYKLLRNVTNISLASKIIDGNAFKAEPVDLSSLMNSIVTSVKTVESNVTITTDIEEDITVTANVNLLTTGILNLFANSFDYRQCDDLQIKLTLKIKDKKAVFTYSDNSKGIKEEILSDVFRPYFSKDPYIDGEADPSLGLGLFIAKTAFNHAGAGLLLTSKFGEGVKYTASFPLNNEYVHAFRSSATDLLLNRYSDVFIQLCDSCNLPGLK